MILAAFIFQYSLTSFHMMPDVVDGISQLPQVIAGI